MEIRFFIYLFFSFVLISRCNILNAQKSDTIHVTIDSAEKYFLKNNLSLIAQKYEIEEAKAAVIQARIFENPDLTYSNTIHNPQNGKYFDLSSQSDHTIQINQLF